MKTVEEGFAEFKENNTVKELNIHAQQDRKDILSKLPDLIGVAGAVDVTYTYDSYPQLFAYRRDTRSMSLMKCEEYLHPTFTKALICMRQDGIVEILYNTCIGKVKRKTTSPECPLNQWVVKSELVLKVNDIWEAIRYVENCIIDVTVDEIFRNMEENNPY